MADDRATHRDALALAARELCRLALETLGESEDPGRLGNSLGDLLLGHLAQSQREADVVGDGHVRVERVVLEDHRDVALLRRQVVDDLPAESHDSGGDVLEAGDHPQDRRLATAGGADEHHQLTVVDRQVDPVNGLEAVRVDLLDVLELDGCHG